MKTKTYNSKFENYNIAQRLEDLKKLVEVQCSPGKYDQNEYMRGKANAFLLAWNIIAEPYGADVPFFESKAEPQVEIIPLEQKQ